MSRATELMEKFNEMPTKGNWVQFAKAFDIGVADLANIAGAMGYKNFKDLDISISPKSLLQKKGSDFIKAIQKYSMNGEGMSDDEIKKAIV